MLVTLPLISVTLYLRDQGALPVKAILIGLALPPTQLLALPVTTAVGRALIVTNVFVVFVQSVVGFTYVYTTL